MIRSTYLLLRSVSTSVSNFISPEVFGRGGDDSRERFGGGTGLGGNGAGERRDSNASGLGLPPGIDNGATPPADEFLIPHPGLWVDGLADGAEQAEATEVGALGIFLAPLHEGADGENLTEISGGVPMRSTTSGGDKTR